MTILVVDDEQSFLTAMKYALQPMGYQITTAESGEDAIILMTENKPELVLLDLMMPGIGGLETLKAIRSHPDFKKIPVIIISGASPLVKKEEYKWNEFIEKPFILKDLQELIEKYIGRPTKKK